MTQPPPDLDARLLPGRVFIPGLGQRRVATIGQRAIARTIDTFVVLSIALLVYVVGARLALRQVDTTDGTELGPKGTALLTGALVLAAVLVVGYEVLLTAFAGGGLGKRIVGIRVVRVADGSRPGVLRALGRWVLPAVSSLAFGLGVVIYFTAYLDGSGRRQGWPDLLARTIVVSRH